MRLLALALWVVSPASAAPPLAGTYRCWHFTVNGAVKECSSPPLLLAEDGTFSLETERGRYLLRKGRLVLQGPKRKQEGRIDPTGRLIFESAREGVRYIVTYARQLSDGAKSPLGAEDAGPLPPRGAASSEEPAACGRSGPGALPGCAPLK